MGTQETLHFQAEVQELLDLMIHSLYSHKEIFLRELISNASDALDKLRFEALTRTELLPDGYRAAIRLEPDSKERILHVIDNGIGMSREELVSGLGTIARSGTRQFLEAARGPGAGGPEGDGRELPELIGKFGVGFYSSFMVADEVTVETRRAGEAMGTRWRSSGKGEYTIEDAPAAPLGTRVSLHLKAREADEPDFQDFCEAGVLRGLVRRYSDFVAYPIEIETRHLGSGHSLAKEKLADGTEVAVLNTMKPLWQRPKGEVKPEEHAEFFRHLTHEWTDPFETIHFKAEGAAEYTALLYIPSERPADLFDPHKDRARLSLYVRRVFVMADCEELLPPWLRFVRGLVDSQDLPLNVSREILQANRAVEQIRKRLVKKVLDSLGTALAERREQYQGFWENFGAVLKEGCVTDSEHAESVLSLALFHSTRGDEPITLDEYVQAMGEKQEEIYFLFAPDRETAARSAHLEALRSRGSDVLFFVDAIDEWVVQRSAEFKGKKLKAIDRGDAWFESAERKEEREAKDREHRGLLERMEQILEGKVESVRMSSRLTDSPSVLVDEEGAMGVHMERMLRQTGGAPQRKRSLELNPNHPVVARLSALFTSDPRSKRLEDFAELVHGQALLAEGSPLADPARFGKLVSELMVADHN